MNRQQILDAAHQCVTADREATHGEFSANAKVAAEFWTTYLSARYEMPDGWALAAIDIAPMMSLLKTVRIAANPYHMDNYVDGAGFMSLGGELAAA